MYNNFVIPREKCYSVEYNPILDNAADLVEYSNTTFNPTEASLSFDTLSFFGENFDIHKEDMIVEEGVYLNGSVKTKSIRINNYKLQIDSGIVKQLIAKGKFKITIKEKIGSNEEKTILEYNGYIRPNPSNEDYYDTYVRFGNYPFDREDYYGIPDSLKQLFYFKICHSDYENDYLVIQHAYLYYEQISEYFKSTNVISYEIDTFGKEQNPTEDKYVVKAVNYNKNTSGKITIPSNIFVDEKVKINGVNLAIRNGDNIFNNYKYGKNTINIEMPLLNLYNKDMELVYDKNKGQIPKLGDKFNIESKLNSSNNRLNNIEFIVTSCEFSYNGVPKLKITGKENKYGRLE